MGLSIEDISNKLREKIPDKLNLKQFLDHVMSRNSGINAVFDNTEGVYERCARLLAQDLSPEQILHSIENYESFTKQLGGKKMPKPTDGLVWEAWCEQNDFDVYPFDLQPAQKDKLLINSTINTREVRNNMSLVDSWAFWVDILNNNRSCYIHSLSQYDYQAVGRIYKEWREDPRHHRAIDDMLFTAINFNSLIKTDSTVEQLEQAIAEAAIRGWFQHKQEYYAEIVNKPSLKNLLSFQAGEFDFDTLRSVNKNAEQHIRGYLDLNRDALVMAILAATFGALPSRDWISKELMSSNISRLAINIFQYGKQNALDFTNQKDVNWLDWLNLVSQTVKYHQLIFICGSTTEILNNQKCFDHIFEIADGRENLSLKIFGPSDAMPAPLERSRKDWELVPISWSVDNLLAILRHRLYFASSDKRKSFCNTSGDISFQDYFVPYEFNLEDEDMRRDLGNLSPEWQQFLQNKAQTVDQAGNIVDIFIAHRANGSLGRLIKICHKIVKDHLSNDLVLDDFLNLKDSLGENKWFQLDYHSFRQGISTATF